MSQRLKLEVKQQDESKKIIFCEIKSGLYPATFMGFRKIGFKKRIIVENNLFIFQKKI